MASTLERLQKIRAYQETLAAQELADARREHEARQAKLDALHAQVDSAREGTGDQVADLALYQGFRLRAELRERAQRPGLTQAARVAARREAQLTAARRETRTVERILETREEQAKHAARRSEQRELDTLGLAAWLKKAA
jgi:flagellar export protein FliJ